MQDKALQDRVETELAWDPRFDATSIVVASSDVSGYGVNGLNSQFFAYDIVKS